MAQPKIIKKKSDNSDKENLAPVNEARLKLVDEIQKNSNILITVSRNPSVDALSAALGLTAIIDKMGKHGTAVFSGKVPPAITFLNPDKIFEDTADSLRDFIIALSRDKADHLRYKVDGDVVKIFVTPYKTVITEKDLEFSQGDYNVELVIALGVESQKDLDVALAAHGKILHDATVTTINVGEEQSKLGLINVNATEASSLSEVVAEIGEELENDEEEALVDDQIATALMTGIVSTTDRFSNERTTSRTLAIAANLMTAGADQQLITKKLEEAAERKKALKEKRTKQAAPKPAQPASTTETDDNPETALPPATAGADGSLSINHQQEVGKSRLVISTLAPEDELVKDESIHVSQEDEERVPTATEILSKLANKEGSEDEAVTAVNEKETAELDITPTPQVKVKKSRAIDTDSSIESAVTSPKERVYLQKAEEELTTLEGNKQAIGSSSDKEQDAPILNRVSSEQSPSMGAAPLKNEEHRDKTLEPINQIDPMAPPVVDPPAADGELPQFNVDQSAEAILQAALNTAVPASDLPQPTIEELSQQAQAVAPASAPLPDFSTLTPPPPPPPPAADFSAPPPPLPDFSTLTPPQQHEGVAEPVGVAGVSSQATPEAPSAASTLPPLETPPPVQQTSDLSQNPDPVLSTLPPEDMILAGSVQQQGNEPSDPSQFRIPGQ